jgi:6-phospho-3-hexuloisomerase
MVRSALGLVRSEVSELLDRVDSDALDRLADALRDPGRRWFLAGQCRSGLVAICSAMRLMHLGHRVHVVGEATAPAIEGADGLLVFSASGETVTSRAFASVATRLGATVVVLTADPGSTLARQADFVLKIPARSTPAVRRHPLRAGRTVGDGRSCPCLSGGSSEAHLTMQQRHANLQ